MCFLDLLGFFFFCFVCFGYLVTRRLEEERYLRLLLALFKKTPNRACACLELSFYVITIYDFSFLPCLIFCCKRLQLDTMDVVLVRITQSDPFSPFFELGSDILFSPSTTSSVSICNDSI